MGYELGTKYPALPQDVEFTTTGNLLIAAENPYLGSRSPGTARRTAASQSALRVGILLQRNLGHWRQIYTLR